MVMSPEKEPDMLMPPDMLPPPGQLEQAVGIVMLPPDMLLMPMLPPPRQSGQGIGMVMLPDTLLVPEPEHLVQLVMTLVLVSMAVLVTTPPPLQRVPVHDWAAEVEGTEMQSSNSSVMNSMSS